MGTEINYRSQNQLPHRNNKPWQRSRAAFLLVRSNPPGLCQQHPWHRWCAWLWGKLTPTRPLTWFSSFISAHWFKNNQSWISVQLVGLAEWASKLEFLKFLLFPAATLAFRYAKMQTNCRKAAKSASAGRRRTIGFWGGGTFTHQLFTLLLVSFCKCEKQGF